MALRNRKIQMQGEMLTLPVLSHSRIIQTLLVLQLKVDFIVCTVVQRTFENNIHFEITGNKEGIFFMLVSLQTKMYPLNCLSGDPGV